MLAPANKWPDHALLSRGLRGLFLCTLLACLVFFAVETLHWPMMVNAPVMHYVNFLMMHGMRPYREITDMNMPGSYLIERFGMVVFGAGDLGWRFYDYFLSVVLIAAMVVIAWPHDWLAGVFAGGIFALRLGAEGPWFSGEREQEMAVLLLTACAILFVSVRRNKPGLAFGFGLLAGLAASIKPTLAPFALIALAVLPAELRRRGVSPARHVLLGVAGFISAGVVCVLFLLHYDALRSFVFVVRSITPAYASMNDPGLRFLLRYALPHEWWPLLGLAALAISSRDKDWEHLVLLLGAGCGLLSYLVQRKGFWYQRYTFLAFALLLISLELIAPRAPSWRRWVGYAGLIYATVYLVPRYTRSLHLLPQNSALTLAMESDLEALGGTKLQEQVQCFDMTFGCLNSLYHLKLVENTGFTGDLLLFPVKRNPNSEHYQRMFWDAQERRPASVIVITNQEFGAGNSFNRLGRWPEFQAYLERNYSLAVARSFPLEDRYKGQAPLPPAAAPAYRIYIRNDESFPALKSLPAPQLK